MAHLSDSNTVGNILSRVVEEHHKAKVNFAIFNAAVVIISSSLFFILGYQVGIKEWPPPSMYKVKLINDSTFGPENTCSLNGPDHEIRAIIPCNE